MLSSKQVAEYFICLTDPDIGEIISNLKLQKLVYYAQGFSLALHGESLFEEDILAWEHGPVVESLYREYKEYKAQAIPQPDEFDISVFSDKQSELIKEIYQVFGQFSAWKLRNMTHSEKPWIETPRNQIIQHSLMQSFFKDYIVD